MQRPLRAFCLAALLAAAAVAHAAIDRPDAESLVRKSGLWEQLSGVAAQIEAGLEQAMTRTDADLADSERARIAHVVQAAYAPERLRAISADVIAARTQPEHLRELRTWFDSPSGQAVARAEETPLPHEGDAEASMRAGLRLLVSMPGERRRLLEDLLAATHAAEGMVQITISTTVAVQLGAASALQEGRAVSPAQVRAALESQRPEMLKSFTRMSLANFAQTYDPIPSEELRAYLDFIRSPAGAAFNEASLQALDTALTEAAMEMGRYLPGTRDRSNV